MARILATAFDTLTNILFPACVWGGQVQYPVATGKNGRSAGFRLSLELLEPRMALAANPLLEPLSPDQPFVLGDLPYAEHELMTDGAVLGSSVVNVVQQAEAPHRIEARNSAGLVVVVFSLDAGADALDLLAQRYDATGAAQGQALHVNQASHSQQGQWSVAIAEDGDFVVAWEGIDQQSAEGAPGIYVRRFGVDSTANADETKANQTELVQLDRPDVAMAEDLFVVAWSGLDDQGQGGVYARQFDAGGTAIGDEIQIASDPLASEQSPAVALAEDGQFVVGYVAATSEGGRAIYVQRFAADGSASGEALQLTVSSPQTPILRDLAIDGSGDLLVTWSVPGLEGVRSTRLRGFLATRELAAGDATGLSATPMLGLPQAGAERTAHLAEGGTAEAAEFVAAVQQPTAAGEAQAVGAIDGSQALARAVPGKGPGPVVHLSDHHAPWVAAPKPAGVTSEHGDAEQETSTGSSAQQATRAPDEDRKQTIQQHASQLPGHDALLDAPLSESSSNEAVPRPASRNPHPRRKQQEKPK